MRRVSRFDGETSVPDAAATSHCRPPAPHTIRSLPAAVSDLLRLQPKTSWPDVVSCPRQDSRRAVGLARSEHVLVWSAAQVQVCDMSGIVARRAEDLGDPMRQALVDEELHAVGRSGSSRSSTAGAANSSAARTSSAVS